LLRSARLYQKNHPRVLESLEAAERNLRAPLESLREIAVGVERSRLVAPALREDLLPNHHGELNALGEELSRCGITSLIFLPQTNLGELDALAQAINSSLQGASARREQRPDWPTWAAERGISGIHVNAPLERNVNTALASLTAALLAYGGAPEAAEPLGATLHELTAVFSLLARLVTLPQHAEASGPQETARALHAALAEADRRTVSLLAAAVTRQPPGKDEAPEGYINWLADALALEFAREEFRARRVAPPELRGLFARLGDELASAFGQKTGAEAGRPGALSLARWADETYIERMYDAFWEDLPARKVARVLRSRDAWCVPVAVLRGYLEHLADADRDAPEGASPREARLVLLNYARCLESEEGKARRGVAAGLAELYPLIERLWPRQLPEELGRSVVRALMLETSPGIAGLLAAVTDNLARLALAKGDYAEFERILEGVEQPPRDPEHAHLAALAGRIVADERWLLLVDAALFHWPRTQGANRPLDPVLPRLLRRDPERLLDRLTLLLTAPASLDTLPAMVRLVRAIGEPAFGALEARLFEPRRQRATAAVKLLAATQPERLVAVLPRAVRNWDWSLQDLAVSELSRMNAPGAALAFAATVTEAHPMVVPMMLDHIGLVKETAAVPQLLEIAAGENDRLRDVFARIKAIEALGRMNATEGVELFRAIVGQRNGLTHAEPAGLRAAAEEALALIEDQPSSARIRAVYEAPEKSSLSYARPRRYVRIPLSSSFAAQIEGPQSAAARVRTISLGGAFLESKRRLAVGDSIRVEIRAGLRRIHSTAVVRNVAPDGGGIEFVHMPQEDREKLRRLVRRLLRS